MMDLALVILLFLTGVSLLLPEVDAAHFQHDQQQQQQKHSITLSSSDAWSFSPSSPSSISSPCQVCNDCMNTSYSYLCGRFQCQCLDSVEYCTLMIEEIETDAITFVQLNATDEAFLGTTTLTGDLEASDAHFSGTLSADILQIEGLQSRLVNVSGSVQTPTLQTTTINVTCGTTVWDMSIQGLLQGIDISLSGSLQVPDLDSNNIVAINITSKALTALADVMILGSLQAPNASFSDGVQSYSLQSTRLISTGHTKLANTNVTGSLSGIAATFTGKVIAKFMGSSQVSTTTLRSVNDATLGNTNNYGSFTVVGDLSVNGNMDIEGATDIQGSTIMQGDLTTHGDVFLSGNLLQEGDTLDISVDHEFKVEAETVYMEATEQSNGNNFVVETALLNMEAPGGKTKYITAELTKWVPTMSILGWYVRFLGYSPPTPPPFVFPTVNPYFANPPSVEVSGPAVAIYAYVAAYLTALVNFRIEAEIRTYVNSMLGIRFYSLVGWDFFNPVALPNLTIFPDPGDPTSSIVTSYYTTIFLKLLRIIPGPFDVTAAQSVKFYGNIEKYQGTIFVGTVTIEGDTTMEGPDDFLGAFELTGASEFGVQVSIEGDLTADAATQVNAEAFFNGAFFGGTATTVNVNTPELTCTGTINAADIQVTGEATSVTGALTAGAVVLKSNIIAGDAEIPFLQTGDIVGGTATFFTIESGVWIGPLARHRRHRRRHLQSSSSNNRTTTNSTNVERAFLTAVSADQENEAGHFSGTLWYSAHPVEIDPGVDEAGNRALALKTEGDVRVNGAIFATPSDTDGSSYIAVGDIPSPSLREEIRPGSILLDGDNGGAIYASTTAHVSPIYSMTASCSVAAGTTQGSSVVSLPYPYQVGIVADRLGFQDEQGQSLQAPPALYVESSLPNTQATRNFTLYCESLEPPQKGKTYTYTSNLLFFHPILAHTSAY